MQQPAARLLPAQRQICRLTKDRGKIGSPDLGSARLTPQATLLMQGQTLCKLLHELVEAVSDHVEVPVWQVRGHSTCSRNTALLHPPSPSLYVS